MAQSLSAILKTFSGSHLPSSRQLSETTGLSRWQVRKKLKTLEQEGEIVKDGTRYLLPDVAPVPLSNAMSYLADQFGRLDCYESDALIDLRGGEPPQPDRVPHVLPRSRMKDPRSEIEAIPTRYHNRWVQKDDPQDSFAVRSQTQFDLLIQTLYINPGDTVLVCGLQYPHVIHHLLADHIRLISMPAVASPAFDVDEMAWNLQRTRPKLIYAQGSCYITGRFSSPDKVDQVSEILLSYDHGLCSESTHSPTDDEPASLSLVSRMRGHLIYSHDLSTIGMPLSVTTVPPATGHTIRQLAWLESMRITQEEASLLLPQILLLEKEEGAVVVHINENIRPLIVEELSPITPYFGRTMAWIPVPEGTDVMLAQNGVLVDRGGLFHPVQQEGIAVSFANVVDLEKLRDGLRIIRRIVEQQYDV